MKSVRSLTFGVWWAVDSGDYLNSAENLEGNWSFSRLAGCILMFVKEKIIVNDKS